MRCARRRRSGILVVADDVYRFRHALLREAVHADLLPGERARLHRSYAETLEAQCEGTESARRRRARISLAARAGRPPGARSPPSRRCATRRRGSRSRARPGSASSRSTCGRRCRMPRRPPASTVSNCSARSGRSCAMRATANGRSPSSNLALDEVDPAAIDPRLHARLLRNKALYLVNLGRAGCDPAAAAGARDPRREGRRRRLPARAELPRTSSRAGA